MNSQNLPQTTQDPVCGYDCGHTEEEHEAFDAGVRAGEVSDESINPYGDSLLKEIFEIGRSVGNLNRRR